MTVAGCKIEASKFFTLREAEQAGAFGFGVQGLALSMYPPFSRVQDVGFRV